MENLELILTIACLAGTVLNCKMIKYCFIVWFIANIGWIIHDVSTDQVFRVILDLVQTVTAIWGYVEWSIKENNHGKQ